MPRKGITMDKIGPLTKKEYIAKMEEAHQMISMARNLLSDCDGIIGDDHFKLSQSILESIDDDVYNTRCQYLKEWN